MTGHLETVTHNSIAIKRLDDYLRNDSGASAFVESLDTNWAGKSAIAKYIAEHFTMDESLVLDAGSTSYEIAKNIALDADRNKSLHIITNNLAASLCLASVNISCSIIGGEVDPLHFCTLPSPQVDEFLRQQYAKSFTSIITAAAIVISDNGIDIRARKSAQFDYKRALLGSASTKVIAVDHTKWMLPFDGEHMFHVAATDIHLVVDKIPEFELLPPNRIRELCDRMGYQLHVAT